MGTGTCFVQAVRDGGCRCAAMKSTVPGGSSSDELGWRGVVLSIVSLTATWLMLWALTLVGDTTRVATELEASRRDGAVMVCLDGTIDYEDNSLLERLFGDGYFRCTEWRMRDIPKATW
jgi:hypothetical protein